MSVNKKKSHKRDRWNKRDKTQERKENTVKNQASIILQISHTVHFPEQLFKIEHKNMDMSSGKTTLQLNQAIWQMR